MLVTVVSTYLVHMHVEIVVYLSSDLNSI